MTTEQRAVAPQGRLLVAFGAALAAASPFLLSGWWHGGFEWEMELIASLVGGSLGAMGVLLWRDLRDGLAAHAALQRMTVGIIAGAAAAVALVGVLAALAALRGWRLSLWVAGVWLGAGALTAVFAGAFASGRCHPGRWSRVIEPVAIIVGAFAFLHIVRQVAVVSLLVGFGPGAVPGPLWFFPYTGLRPGQLLVGGLLIAAMPAIGFLIVRVRRRMGTRAAVLAGNALLGLALLGWSYRLPAAIALVALVVLDATRRVPKARRWAWVAIVALSLLPVDVSLQRGTSPGPRFLPTVAGDFTSMDAFLNGPRYGYVVLDTGSHQTLYYEPRWVWAW